MMASAHRRRRYHRVVVSTATHLYALIGLLFLLVVVVIAENVVIQRTALPSNYFDFLDATATTNSSNITKKEDWDDTDGVPTSYFGASNGCVYDGGTIRLSHPSSVGEDDRHYVLSSQMLISAHITIDRINAWPRCGVHIHNRTYSLRLTTYGDESSKEKVTAIAHKIVQQQQEEETETDFVLAGYSSSLTAFLTPVTQDAGHICITAGSARTSVHANRDKVFGILSPVQFYLQPAFDAIRKVGATSVAVITEDEAVACDGASDLAETYGMDFVTKITLPVDATSTLYEEAAYNMSQSNPDVVFTCILSTYHSWNEAMRKINWNPKGQVYTQLFGTPEFEQAIPASDLPYMMGVSAWHKSLPDIADSATGWTPAEFATVFEQVAFRTPAYQYVSQSVAISVLVQAIERAAASATQKENSTEIIDDTLLFRAAVQHELATGQFTTVYGNISFDENGQSEKPFLLLQYDENRRVHVIGPEEHMGSPEFQIVYPMSTWAERDCEAVSDCKETGGICEADGTCTCPVHMVSKGNRTTAECTNDDLNYNYLGSIRYYGLALAGLVMAMSIAFAVWSLVNAHHHVVKASQPFFLVLICTGTVILSSAIIPLSIDDDVSDINVASLACQTVPWLVAIGWTILFASLESKLWRLNRVVDSARQFRRVKIRNTDVLWRLGVLLFINVTLLTTWAQIDPVYYKRFWISDIESYGTCTPNRDGITWLIIVPFLCFVNFAALVRVNIEAFKARHISTEFGESTYIALAMGSYLQLTLIGLPVFLLVLENPAALFCTVATVIFVLCAVLLLLLFVPKIIIWRLPHQIPNKGIAISSLRSDKDRSHRPANTRVKSSSSVSASEHASNVANETFRVSNIIGLQQICDESRLLVFD